MNKKINSELFLVMWHKKTFTLKYNSFILKSSEKSLSRDFKIHHRHCLETSEQNTEKHHYQASSVSRCSYVDVLEVFSISTLSFFDLNFVNQTTTVTIASSATAPQTHPIITPTEFEDVASRRQSSSVRTVVGLPKKEMPSNADDTKTSNDDVPETTLSFV